MNNTTKVTTNDRIRQAKILKMYREKGLIPSLQIVAQHSGVSVGTAALFMHGNSFNQNICNYLISHIERETKSVPQDLKELFSMWKQHE